MKFTRSAIKRSWEIDALRGVAVILMILFHFLFDLKFFGKENWGGVRDLPQAFWDWFSGFIATLFLFVVGISAHLRFQKDRGHRWHHSIRSSVKILAGAACVTTASILFNPELPIYFGILHCIGIMVLILPLCANLHISNLLGGFGVIALGTWFLNEVHAATPVLLWLGIRPSPYPMGDYFPLIPWGGIALVGLFTSQFFHLPSRQSILGKKMGSGPLARFLCFLGRHSLLIYLIHQPIVLGLLWASGVILL